MKGLISNLVICCNRFAKEFIMQTGFGGSAGMYNKMFGKSVHEEEERADKQRQSYCCRTLCCTNLFSVVPRTRTNLQVSPACSGSARVFTANSSTSGRVAEVVVRCPYIHVGN